MVATSPKLNRKKLKKIAFPLKPPTPQTNKTIDMNQFLELQKRQLKLILGYIDMIQVCDGHIISGHDPEYFKAVKQDAIEQYSNEMSLDGIRSN